MEKIKFLSLWVTENNTQMIWLNFIKNKHWKSIRNVLFHRVNKDQYGQRIDIEIELPGIGNAKGKTSYLKSGWMITKDGNIKLNTPFSGFMR